MENRIEEITLKQNEFMAYLEQIDSDKIVITEMAQKLATTYADSPATTDLGRVFRFIARFIPVDMVLKVLSHKLK